ncbi:C40 family peptidase [Clostridiaceae bacterium Marseille-Q4145]|nr:C40 family peptidase [Clostridiaceae bacterium Marseille-Q4145]
MNRKRLCSMVLALAIVVTGIPVSATSIKNIQSEKAKNESELKNIQSKISGIESQKSALSSEVSSLNDDLTDTLLNIEVLESDLADKEAEIEQAEKDYEAAKATEEQQYDSMKKRIQYLYETGQESYLEMLLTSDSVADLVNKVDYAEELQEYDRRLLDEYKAAKQAVIDLQAQLEEEKQELLEMEEQLKQEKANLESVIAQKKSQIADFDSQLSAAKAKVSEYQKKIKEQNAQIKQLQKEEEAKRKAAAAQSSTSSAGSSTASSGSTSGYSSKSSGKTATVSGGGGGSSIASTGLRYVGNPYVYGGNSLTNGTDCSGFVHLIYAACGISTPRDSNSLAGGGRAVSESEMLPGDVVCYYGHVGIYIGNGQIVHASTPSSGIKVSNMYYRSIRCVRRYW